MSVIAPFSFLNVTIPTRKPLWVAVGRNVTCWTEQYTGAGWSLGSIPLGWWRCVRPGGGIFMAVGQNCAAISTNGKSFSSISIPNGDWSRCIYMENIGRWVVIQGQYNPSGSNTNQYLTSDDNGATWVTRTFPRSAKWLGLAYGEDRVVATAYNVSSGDNHFYSLDGITWTGQSVWPNKGAVHASFLPSMSGLVTGRFASCTQIGANRFNVTTDSTSFSWNTPSDTGTQPMRCLAGYSIDGTGYLVIAMPDNSTGSCARLQPGGNVTASIGHTATWEDIWFSNPPNAPDTSHNIFMAVCSDTNRSFALRSFNGITTAIPNDPLVNNLELYSITHG